MHVFDCHTHFFGRAFYQAQTQQVPRGDVGTLLDKLGRNGVDVPGDSVSSHRDRIIADLDANGVNRAVTFASVPAELEVVGEACKTSEGRLVPYAVVDPTTPSSLDKLVALQPRFQFKGMLLFPAMHDYGIADPVVGAALDIAREHRMVVFVHCGLLRIPVRAILGLEPDYPLHRSHPEDLIPVAKARPDQAFVVPHFGAGFFDEFLRLGRSCPNVYADTAGSNDWGLFQVPELHLEDLYSETIEVFGVERILFGSDSGGFPRGYRTDVLKAQIAAMHDAAVRPADQELILGGNLAKLLEV